MRRLRQWVKITLFLSSYIPFYAIMMIQNHHHRQEINGIEVPWISLIFFILAIISGIVLKWTIDLRKSEEPKAMNVESYRKRNDLLASYLIVYVLPFVNLNYSNWESWATLLIFFIVLAAIQLRSDQLHINPVLALGGYDVYELTELEHDSVDLVLAHKDVNIEEGDHIDAVRLGSNIYLAA